MPVRSFVEGTQRGYASGLRRVEADGSDGPILIEEYHHCGGDDASIDRAYHEACLSAASYESTWRLRPDLIRRRRNWRG
jgi:hypothetical protein